MTNNTLKGKKKHVINKTPALNQAPFIQGEGISNNSTNTCSLQKVINLQLLYDTNQITDQESWGRSFHPISLHSSLKYFLSDVINIKELLKHIIKYVKQKSIEPNKTNKVPDLKSVGEATWNFISVLYNSGWDLLISNSNNWSLWQKVAVQFTPGIHEVKVKSKNNKIIDKLASFIKLSSLILVKSPKEVNAISKYLNKNNQPMEKINTRKSYAQVLTHTTNIKEILKIKKIFPNFQAKKLKTFRRSLTTIVSQNPKLI